jgi:hypothetical protein
MKISGKFIFGILAVAVLFVSCKKEETPVNMHEDAYGDVLLKKMLMTGQVKYLPVFFAGGEEIVGTESTVTAPDGNVYPLNEFWAGPGILTGKGEMKDVFDFAGTYTFRLKFSDGYIKEVTDVLENVEIDVPQITVNYDQAAQTIQVDWSAVPGADLYCIKLTEMDMAGTKPLFKIPQLPTTTTSYTIHIDGGQGWMRPVSDLQPGTEYWVVVAAKKVEQGTEVSGASRDFQTSSCNKVKITY